MDLKDFFRRHNAYQDSMLETFVSELQGTLHSAQSNLTATLLYRLSIDNGVIGRTSANRRVLGQVDRMFAASMMRSGYEQLVQEFVGSFNGQFRFMDEILQDLSAAMKRPLQISKQTMSTAAAFQGNAAIALEGIADTVATKAARQTLFSVGGLRFKDLTGLMADAFALTVPQSTTLASTLQTSFFRTIADSEFHEIEKSQPKGAPLLRYIYDGPKDKLNRPFCKQRVGKSYTRKQIDAMRNGMIPNVWVTGGGYRCRHQFTIDVNSVQFSQAA